MQQKAVLLLGACTISGLGLPATLSLPVLINRAFREDPVFRLRLEADNHIDHLAQMHDRLARGVFRGPFDIVVLQSMIGRETIPRLGLRDRYDRPGPIGFLYRLLRRLDFLPQGHRLINHVRRWLGRRKSSQQDYEQMLVACLQQIRRYWPSARIIVLGQGPPLSPIRAPFAVVCEQNRQKLAQYGSRYDFDFVDLYPVLLPYEAAAVYQADGSHYTAQGQRLVAQAIIARIAAALKASPAAEPR